MNTSENENNASTRGKTLSKVDRDRFIQKSNATLYRIERNSLFILGISGLTAFFFFKAFWLSILVGGLLGMVHFWSLHRMYQQRFLNPATKLRTQFLYSVKLFVVIAFFFGFQQSALISAAGMIAGFFLMTGAFFLESKWQS
ncbi:MAG: ATP synthase subunit I [Nitrospiria bacterium]